MKAVQMEAEILCRPMKVFVKQMGFKFGERQREW